jgi:hypothetical protein
MVAHYIIILNKFTGRVGALIKGALIKGMPHRYTAEKCPAVRQYSIPLRVIARIRDSSVRGSNSQPEGRCFESRQNSHCFQVQVTQSQKQISTSLLSKLVPILTGKCTCQ